MAAVWMRLRSELRTRRRSWVALALLLGIFGGGVIAAAAGARRTDSAYPRFLEATNAADVVVLVLPFGEVFAELDLADVERLPQVIEASRVRQAILKDEAGAINSSSDGRYGYTLNALRAIEGRLPDPNRADEISIPFAIRALDPRTYPAFAPFVRAKIGDVLQVNFEPDPRFDLEIDAVSLRVVGIHAGAGEFPPLLDETSWSLFASPAFYRAHQSEPLALDASVLKLRPGTFAAFRDELRRLGGGKVTFTNELMQQNANVQRGIHLQAVSLWLLALFGAATVVLVLGQLVARQALLDSEEDSVWRSIGMTGGELAIASALRGAITAALAGAIAAGVAIGLSPLFPRGVARVAETSPGVALDWVALAFGFAVLVTVVVGLTTVAAWRGRARTTTERARPSFAPAALAGAGFSPAAVSGVRMALEPGRGRSAVPVRTTVLSITLGLAALAAALTFGRSLDHMLATPRLYGLTWDVSFGAAPSGDVFFPDARPLGPIIARDPGVAAVGLGTKGVPIQVDGLVTSGVAFDSIKGDVTPPMLEGRPPKDDSEIAIGTVVLADLGKEIGDRVDVSVQGAHPVPMTIVGRAVVAPSEATSGFGSGVFFKHEALERMGEANPAIRDAIPPPDEIAVRFASPSTRAETEKRVRASVGEMLDEDFTNPDPSDLANFGRVRNMPVALAGMLAVLALATMVHALVTAIQRRRRDLAILKTIGFVRAQVRRTVAWQAGTIVAVAVLFALPLGIAAGRIMWTLFADRSGLVPEPVTPAILLVVFPLIIVLAVAISAVPARAAARTKAALVLRTE